MTREEVQLNIDNNQYVDNNSTGTRNFINFMVAQPLLDSYVKSSYAKKTGLAFYHGYQTGIFNSFTFMGGHNIAGDGIFSPLTKKITKHISTFNTNKTGGWGFQYLNNGTSKGVNFFTPENLKKYNADSLNDLIEGGLGFGKDARALQSLRRSGFKIGPEDISKMTPEALGQKIISHLKTLEFKDLSTIAKETGEKVDISTIKHAFRKQNPQIVRETNRAFNQKIAKEIFGNNFKNKNVKQITEAIQSGTGELFDKIMDTNIVKDMFVNKYGNAYGKVHEEIAERVGKKIVNQYVKTSAIERFFGSTPVRIITGNFLQGALGNVITMSLGAASTLSSFHQSAALGDFKNTSLYNFREQHFTEANNVTTESLNSHLMIRQSNVNDYYQMLNGQNVSKGYLKDIDPVESRFEYSKVDNFTIF